MSGLIPFYCIMFGTDRICWRTLEQVTCQFFIAGITTSRYSQDVLHICIYFNWDSGFALLLLTQFVLWNHFRWWRNVKRASVACGACVKWQRSHKKNMVQSLRKLTWIPRKGALTTSLLVSLLPRRRKPALWQNTLCKPSWNLWLAKKTRWAEEWGSSWIEGREKSLAIGMVFKQKQTVCEEAKKGWRSRSCCHALFTKKNLAIIQVLYAYHQDSDVFNCQQNRFEEPFHSVNSFGFDSCICLMSLFKARLHWDLHIVMWLLPGDVIFFLMPRFHWEMGLHTTWWDLTPPPSRVYVGSTPHPVTVANEGLGWDSRS